MSRKMLNGFSAAEGVALGRASVLPSFQSSVPSRTIVASQREEEIQRFKDALLESRAQLEELIKNASVSEEILDIFEAQILFLDDPMIVGPTIEAIRSRGLNAELALVEVLSFFKKKLLGLDNRLLRERTADLDDIENRVLSNLMGLSEGDIRIPVLKKLDENSILIAEEISPSLMLHIDKAAGIVTEKGGVTGHLAILAHNRGMPALVGVEGVMSNVPEGTAILLDADSGILIIRPNENDLESYQSVSERHRYAAESVIPSAQLSNGEKLSLYVNLDLPEDVRDPRTGRAAGVGLFRTEFLYMKNPALLTAHEEEINTYESILEGMSGHRVVFRLIDFGDDKTFDSYLRNLMHPSGRQQTALRGISFLLENKEIMLSQIHSIMTAALRQKIPAGDCCIMLPMVSTLEEIKLFHSLLDGIMQDMEDVYGSGAVPRPPLGIMLETPAACLMADAFSEHCDFFSVGTNDLASSILVRERKDIARDEDRLCQPAVFRMLRSVCELARVPLTVCGEMASIPEILCVLLGLGVRNISVSRSALVPCARVVASHSLEHCQELAHKVLSLSDQKSVRELIYGEGDRA